jgi:general secretion pathway protein A
MYNDFFGLNRSPFELSPDPFFLFSSEKNKDAVASIYYAICRRKGFIVMTGEVGTGKTLMLRCLFELWEREQIPYAYFIGPRLSTMDFLSYITFELGIKVAEPSKGKLLRALYGFLLAQFEKGQTTVLVIDEAHQMPLSVLEEIRLLTNFETAQQKLVQILLVGQPELDTKLDSVQLRSLKQRIAARCRLDPLLEEEVQQYIERRLELSGAGEQAGAIFPPETVHAIYRYSLGIPRLVNSICDQALIAAFERKVRVVPAEVIDEIAARFRLSPASNLKPTETRFPPAAPAKYETDKFPQNAPAPSAPSAKAAQALGAKPLDAGNDTSTSAAPVALPTVPVPIASVPVGPAPIGSTSVESGASLEGSDVDEAGHERTLEQKNVEQKNVEHEKDGADWPDHGGDALHRAVNEEEVNRDAPNGLALNREALNDEQRSASSAGAYAQQFAPASEAAFAAPAQLEASAPMTDALRTWASDFLLKYHELVSRVRGRVESLQRPSLTLGAIAILVVVLVTGVIMARHSTGVAASQHQTANMAAAVPAAVPAAQQMAALLPAEAGPARNLEADSTGSPTLGIKNGASKSVAASERSPTRTKIPVEALPKPVAKSSGIATSVEPPVIGVQPNLEADKGLLDAAVPGPAPPATRVGGRLQPPKLLSSAPPAYPPRALLDQVQGVVVIDALVDENGKVAEMQVLSGPPSLTQAAMQALRAWKYEPARLAGQPIATHIKVSINFKLH